MTLAHDMVWSLGMGGDGFIGDFSVIPSGQSMRGNQLSEALKEKLNMETQRILHDCMVEVEQVLRTESRILDRFAAELLSREELDYDEIVSIFLEYGKPPRPIPVPLAHANAVPEVTQGIGASVLTQDGNSSAPAS